MQPFLYLMRLSDDDYPTRIGLLLLNLLFYHSLALYLLVRRGKQGKPVHKGGQSNRQLLCLPEIELTQSFLI